MLKVLLVDDEPFILQGLKLLVDWEKEGFRIAGTAANGMEALAFLKKEKVDLVIADIKMPRMTGLELLEHIRKEKISDAYFVILSGYAEFSFAQQAMQNDCTDYLLKPVDSEILCKVLNKVLALRNREELDHEKNRKLEQAYLARHMIALIQGKFDDLNVRYIHEHMRCGTGVRYVEIQTEGSYDDEGTTDREMRTLQRRLYEYSREYLKEDADLSVFDVSVNEKIYDIGLILFDYVPEKNGMDVKRYLERFREYLASNLQTNVVMLAGKKVQDISSIAKSYGNTCMLRSFQGFRTKKDIYFYEEEVQVSPEGLILCKQSLDGLLKAIEQNNHLEIREAVAFFYEEMCKRGICGETMNLNINYLLFQLIHLACEQDDDVNQEEILRVISESSFATGVKRGSKAHLTRFACEYADYLSQLRKNVSRGILGMVEKEIRENYASNITLKSLSEKYYVNSAYLGQLFRKKYGQSFKDYLNNYRMEQAADALLRTDKKIAVIGSGPSGLAAADQLNKRGHNVTVFEREDRVGGLLMYGIPNMKLEKQIIDRKINVMKEEGVTFVTGANVGKNYKAAKLLKEFDSVVLACGASNPRDINVPGRDAEGIYFAVDFLKSTTKSLLNSNLEDGNYISAKDKHVIVIGGGDTGNDCVGTSIRHGCASVTQLEMMPKLPEKRTENNSWPEWPRILKTDYGQEEAISVFGSDPRVYQTTVKEFVKDGEGKLCKVILVSLTSQKDPETGRTMMVPIEGSEKEVPADLVLIAAGFLGCQDYVADAFGVERNARTNVATEAGSYKTNVDKVFVAGDMHRGQSLVVWAIREGREVASQVDRDLMGYTNLH